MNRWKNEIGVGKKCGTSWKGNIKKITKIFILQWRSFYGEEKFNRLWERGKRRVQTKMYAEKSILKYWYISTFFFSWQGSFLLPFNIIGEGGNGAMKSRGTSCYGSYQEKKYIFFTTFPYLFRTSTPLIFSFFFYSFSSSSQLPFSFCCWKKKLFCS